MTKDFTLDDFWKQLQVIRKQGPKDMLGRMPGMVGMVPDGVDPDAALGRIEEMIGAMTPEERGNRDLIDAAGQERIAATAGVQPEDVHQFLEQFDMVRALMREMSNMTLWQRIKMVTGFGRLPPPG